MFFFFNDTATTEIYTLSLHDALPISRVEDAERPDPEPVGGGQRRAGVEADLRRAGDQRIAGEAAVAGRVRHRQDAAARSEEHTSELQSRQYLVCRLLLEKKK